MGGRPPKKSAESGGFLQEFPSRDRSSPVPGPGWPKLPCHAAAAFLARGRLGWSVFDRWRVGRWRSEGIGGILVQAGPQVGDVAIQLLDPLIQVLEGDQQGRLGGRWDGVPQFLRDRRLRSHAARITENLARRQDQIECAEGGTEAQQDAPDDSALFHLHGV